MRTTAKIAVFCTAGIALTLYALGVLSGAENNPEPEPTPQVQAQPAPAVPKHLQEQNQLASGAATMLNLDLKHPISPADAQSLVKESELEFRQVKISIGEMTSGMMIGPGNDMAEAIEYLSDRNAKSYPGAPAVIGFTIMQKDWQPNTRALPPKAQQFINQAAKLPAVKQPTEPNTAEN